jgi:hypothetical protein
MIKRMSMLTAIAAVAAFALSLHVGCSKQSSEMAAPADEQHNGDTNGEHDAGDHHEAGHEHGHAGEAITEDDVKMPESFAAGVARLNELHEKIEHLIEHNELSDVHRVAEEMAILARKMKTLAARDIGEANRTEAGRLCNEIAAYFTPIDEAADAGKKEETIAVHNQMATTIARLDALAKESL